MFLMFINYGSIWKNRSVRSTCIFTDPAKKAEPEKYTTYIISVPQRPIPYDFDVELSVPHTYSEV